MGVDHWMIVNAFNTNLDHEVYKLRFYCVIMNNMSKVFLQKEQQWQVCTKVIPDLPLYEYYYPLWTTDSILDMMHKFIKLSSRKQGCSYPVGSWGRCLTKNLV